MEQLADVRTGYSFRTKISHDPRGELQVIQGKDVKRLSIDLENLTRIRLKDAARPSGKFVRREDVLLMVRSEKPFAVHVAEDLPPTVVQNSFNILRPCSPEILPRFLAMILNQGVMQSRIAAITKVSSISYIRVQDLRELLVPVPTLERQEALVALDRLHREEDRLHRQLQKARQAQLEALILID